MGVLNEEMSKRSGAFIFLIVVEHISKSGNEILLADGFLFWMLLGGLKRRKFH